LVFDKFLAHYQNFDPGHKTLRSLPTHVKTFPPPNTYERHIGRPRSGQKPTDVDDKSVDDTSFFLSFVDTALDDLRRDGHKPAAVIVDPIFSSDGLLDPPPGFLAGVAKKVREAGGVYIADEVQSGMGRTGDAMWGFENHDLVPDIITLGKPIGNGHPLAVVITSQKVLDNFANSTQYFNTFGGNPVSCAVGLAVLDVMEKEHLRENAKFVGDYLRKKLEALKERYQCIGDIRGRGLAIGLELVLDRTSHQPSEEFVSRVVNGLARERILVSATGRFSNVLKFRPPIVLTKGNADFFLERLERVLRKEYLNERDIAYEDDRADRSLSKL
jgi:4-aminobutyrate aminotransferase-like enzyme